MLSAARHVKLKPSYSTRAKRPSGRDRIDSPVYIDHCATPQPYGLKDPRQRPRREKGPHHRPAVVVVVVVVGVGVVVVVVVVGVAVAGVGGVVVVGCIVAVSGVQRNFVFSADG